MENKNILWEIILTLLIATPFAPLFLPVLLIWAVVTRLHKLASNLKIVRAQYREFGLASLFYTGIHPAVTGQLIILIATWVAPFLEARSSSKWWILIFPCLHLYLHLILTSRYYYDDRRIGVQMAAHLIQLLYSLLGLWICFSLAAGFLSLTP